MFGLNVSYLSLIESPTGLAYLRSHEIPPIGIHLIQSPNTNILPIYLRSIPGIRKQASSAMQHGALRRNSSDNKSSQPNSSKNRHEIAHIHGHHRQHPEP